MQTVNLGKTGLKVSRICLGMMSYGSKSWRDWVLNEEESIPFIKRALDAGINFYDTANVYSIGVSEEVTGKLLLSMARRDEVVIATKVHGKMEDHANGAGLSRKHIMQRLWIKQGLMRRVRVTRPHFAQRRIIHAAHVPQIRRSHRDCTIRSQHAQTFAEGKFG